MESVKGRQRRMKEIYVKRASGREIERVNKEKDI
jgi:hypothetical protein